MKKKTSEALIKDYLKNGGDVTQCKEKKNYSATLTSRSEVYHFGKEK